MSTHVHTFRREMYGMEHREETRPDGTVRVSDTRVLRGVQTVTVRYSVVVDPAGLDRIAERAAGNISQRSRVGPVIVRILDKQIERGTA